MRISATVIPKVLSGSEMSLLPASGLLCGRTNLCEVPLSIIQ